jgi:hypothetical protein
LNIFPFLSLVFGIVLGEAADFVYDRLNKRNIEGDISFLHWLEHYHWGMIFLLFYRFPQTYFPQLILALNQITSSPFILGLGLSLIFDEIRSDTKFAWKKAPKVQWYHFYESSILGFMIGIILLLRWLHLPLWHLTVVFLLDLFIGIIVLIKKPFKSEILNLENDA